MKKMNYIGMLIMISFFLLFFVIATILLNRRDLNQTKVDTDNNVSYENKDYHNETIIISNLYKDIKILYDVVNSQFKTEQNNTITIGNIIYKKISNFDEITNNLFTENGKKKYISDLGNYFATTENGYYLASNLTNYQTYYFRGDNTNIYIVNANEYEINGIIYERWTSNNKNTLATIKVVNENGAWLVDNITILSDK